MRAAVARGWLVAGLVLAISLLVGSMAAVATHVGPRSAREGPPRWHSAPMWSHDGPGRPGMMDGDGWSTRRDAPRDRLGHMRGREGS